jgi:U3 small nucleolar RNA-associated protein 18
MQHKAGRGLWGSYDSTTSVSARKRGRGRGATGQSEDAGGSAEGMEITAFNPSGEMLAVAGRGGNVHLLDWKSGAGQVVGSLKCGASVKAMWWTGAGGDDGDLATLTNDSEVFLWDVGERRCLRRWKDEGGFRGSGRAMTGSSKGWLAVGFVDVSALVLTNLHIVFQIQYGLGQRLWCRFLRTFRFRVLRNPT